MLQRKVILNQGQQPLTLPTAQYQRPSLHSNGTAITLSLDRLVATAAQSPRDRRKPRREELTDRYKSQPTLAVANKVVPNEESR